MQPPLEVAIVSGLLVQLPFVLLVMPTLFHITRALTAESINFTINEQQ